MGHTHQRTFLQFLTFFFVVFQHGNSFVIFWKGVPLGLFSHQQCKGNLAKTILAILTLVLLQVQTILKRLKIPYREDAEFDEATLYEAASTNSTLSCNNEKTGLFNVLDTRKTNLDKLPDDAFNMRLS